MFMFIIRYCIYIYIFLFIYFIYIYIFLLFLFIYLNNRILHHAPLYFMNWIYPEGALKANIVQYPPLKITSSPLYSCYVSFCVGERGVTGLEHAGVLPAQLSSVLRQAAAQTEAGTRRWPQDLRPDQQQRQPRGLRLNLTRRRQRSATESRRKEGRRGRGLSH